MSPRRHYDQDASAPVSSDVSRDPRRDDADAEPVAARIETQDGREECTLFPADADADDLVTTWLTAEGDAFVDLPDYR